MTPTPAPRDNVAAIPRYVPGRPPTPRPGLTTYKLSSNENPYPPLPGVLEATEAALTSMNRYPDAGNTLLYDALSAFLGVDVDRLAAGTGSVALIYHLLQAYAGPGDEVVHAWRSFEAYPIAITAVGATGVPVPLDAEFRHDLDAMAAAVTGRTRVVLLCSPNNPTGPALTQTEVDRFLAAVDPRVLVVLDEAYLEFVRSPDPVDGVRTQAAHDNVVLLRTFSKAYGLAGLRVGYAVAHPEVADALRAITLPFAVSVPAQVAAVESLRHREALAGRVDALVGERDRVLGAVRAAGWQVPDAQGNFLWLPSGSRTPDVVAAAEEAGVAVRPFGEEGIRVSVGEPEGNDRVIEVARAVAPPA
ncbi:MAG: histidinol-phosphate transaminase [Nocardioides sp.]|uniref:histidinol-phosphate transaminase n=1 Tax=Nocardioides sp. TaxID=35761 RepID=UPI003F092E55